MMRNCKIARAGVLNKVGLILKQNFPSEETTKTGKKQTNKPTDIDRQAGRQADRKMDRRTDRQTDRQTEIDKLFPTKQRTEKGLHAGQMQMQ